MDASLQTRFEQSECTIIGHSGQDLSDPRPGADPHVSSSEISPVLPVSGEQGPPPTSTNGFPKPSIHPSLSAILSTFE